MNHHAAQINVRKSVEDPVFDAQVNILGSLNLLEAAGRTASGSSSSPPPAGAGYGEQEYFPADEKHPLRPVSPYGVAKVSVEQYMHYYKVQYGLEYTALRYANVYGPRQDPFGEAGVVAIFCTRLLTGQTAIINGDGEQTRDYVYVGDVVRANVEALDARGRAGHQHRDRDGDGREHAVPEAAGAVRKPPGGDPRARDAGGAAPVGHRQPVGLRRVGVVS